MARWWQPLFTNESASSRDAHRIRRSPPLEGCRVALLTQLSEGSDNGLSPVLLYAYRMKRRVSSWPSGRQLIRSLGMGPRMDHKQYIIDMIYRKALLSSVTRVIRFVISSTAIPSYLDRDFPERRVEYLVGISI